MQTKLATKVNKGFTYIGLLLFIAITGIGLSVAGTSWQYQVRAEKEKQLLFVGAEFRNAINSYYASTPDAAKVYPASLNDLLLDKRMPNIKRHLRKIYLDPMTGKADWGFVIQSGRIVGVYSSSLLTPFKKVRFDLADTDLGSAKTYREWIFGANPATYRRSQIEIADGQQSSLGLFDKSSVSSNSNVIEHSTEIKDQVAPATPEERGHPGDRLRYDPNYRP